MTGPEHYQLAELLSAEADRMMDADHGMFASMGTDERLARRSAELANAQVHATLALAAATAMLQAADSGDWRISLSWSKAFRGPAPLAVDDPEPSDYDPGPDVDDGAGMSEYLKPTGRVGSGTVNDDDAESLAFAEEEPEPAD